MILILAGVCGRTYEVVGAELGGGLVQAGVGREDRAATLSLVANDTTHGDVVVRCWLSMERSKLQVDTRLCENPRLFRSVLRQDLDAAEKNSTPPRARQQTKP